MAQAPKIENLWEPSWPNFNDVSNGSSLWDSGATKPGTLRENLDGFSDTLISKESLFPEANVWSSLDADESSYPSRHLDNQRSSSDPSDIISPYSAWNSDQIDKLWSPSANETNEWSLSSKKTWFDGISNATGPDPLIESSFAASDQVPENIIPENVFQSVWSPSTFCDSDLRPEKAVWGKLPIENATNNESRSLSGGDDVTTLATSGSTETLNNDHTTSPTAASVLPATTQSQSPPGHLSQEPRIPSPSSSQAPLSHSQSDNSNASVAASATTTTTGPDDLITQLINSHDGWGSRGVDQSTPWEETATGHSSDPNNNDARYYAKKSFASAKTEPTGLLQENNVWTNEPPTGTGIWELHYEQQGKKTARWQQNQEETRDLCQLPLAGGMPGTKIPIAAVQFRPPNQPNDLMSWTNMPARPFDWRNSLVQAPNSGGAGGSQPLLKPKMPNLRPLLGGTGAHAVDQSNNNNNSNDNRLLSATTTEKDWSSPVSSSSSCKAEQQRSTSSQGADSAGAGGSSWFPRGLTSAAAFGLDETDSCLLPPSLNGSGLSAAVEGCWMPPPPPPSQQQQHLSANSFADQSSSSTAAPSFFTGEQETGVGKLLSDQGSGSIVHPCSHTYRADVVKHFMQLGYKKEDVQAVLIECNMDYERSLHQLRQHYIPIRAPQQQQSVNNNKNNRQGPLPPAPPPPSQQFSLPRFPLTTVAGSSNSNNNTISSPLLEQPTTATAGTTKESFFSDLDCHFQDDFSSPFRQSAAAAAFPSGVGAPGGAPFMGAQQPPGRMMVMPPPLPSMSSARLANLSAAAAAAAAFNSHLAPPAPSLPQVRRGLNQNNVAAMKFMHSNGAGGNGNGNNSISRSGATLGGGGDVIQGPAGGYPYSGSLLGSPPDGSQGPPPPHGGPLTLGGIGMPPNPPHLAVASHHFRSARQWDLLNSIQELQRKQQEIIKQIQLYHSNPVMCSQPQYAAVFSELRAQLQHIESQLRAKEAQLRVMTATVSNGMSGMSDGVGGSNGGLCNDAMTAAGMAAASSDLNGGVGGSFGDLSRESSLAQKFLELRLRNAPQRLDLLANRMPNPSSSIVEDGKSQMTEGVISGIRSSASYSIRTSRFRDYLILKKGLCVNIASPGGRSGPGTRSSNGLRSAYSAAAAKAASLHDGFLPPPDASNSGLFAGRRPPSGGGYGNGSGGQWVIARPGSNSGAGGSSQQAPTSLEALHLNLIQQPGLTYFHPDHQRRSALARYQSVEEAIEAARALSNRVAIALISDREAHAILQDISITA